MIAYSGSSQQLGSYTVTPPETASTTRPYVHKRTVDARITLFPARTAVGLHEVRQVH